MERCTSRSKAPRSNAQRPRSFTALGHCLFLSCSSLLVFSLHFSSLLFTPLPLPLPLPLPFPLPLRLSPSPSLPLPSSLSPSPSPQLPPSSLLGCLFSQVLVLRHRSAQSTQYVKAELAELSLSKECCMSVPQKTSAHAEHSGGCLLLALDCAHHAVAGRSRRAPRIQDERSGPTGQSRMWQKFTCARVSARELSYSIGPINMCSTYFICACIYMCIYTYIYRYVFVCLVRVPKPP